MANKILWFLQFERILEIVHLQTSVNKWLLMGLCTAFAHRIKFCFHARIDHTMYFAYILSLTFPWVLFVKLKEHSYVCIFAISLQASKMLTKAKNCREDYSSPARSCWFTLERLKY